MTSKRGQDYTKKSGPFAFYPAKTLDLTCHSAELY